MLLFLEGRLMIRPLFISCLWGVPCNWVTHCGGDTKWRGSEAQKPQMFERLSLCPLSAPSTLCEEVT
jgi:hypothetical protein